MTSTKKARVSGGRQRKTTTHKIVRRSRARAGGIPLLQREMTESPLKTVAAVLNIYVDRGRRQLVSTRQDLMQQARSRLRKFFR